MTAENFKYWLQGFFELKEQEGITDGQVKTILAHIYLVKEEDNFVTALLNQIIFKKSKLSSKDENEIKEMLSEFFTEETQGKYKGGTTLLRSC